MSKSIPKFYLLISSSEELVNKIAVIVQKKVSFLEWKTEKEVNLSSISIEKCTQVILDNEVVLFKDYMFIYKVYRNKLISFKIMPKNSSFIIGSNSSNDSGEF